MSRIGTFQQEIFRGNNTNIVLNASEKMQITCHKLQIKGTKAVSLIRLSLYVIRHLPKEAALPYKPGDASLLTSSLEVGTSQVLANCQSGVDLQVKEYREKELMAGDRG